MKKSVIALLASLYLGLTATAQLKPAAIAATIPESVTGSPVTIARWLKTNTSNSTAFQQSLFNWMATRISYDAANMNRQPSYKDTAAAVQRTLQTRKGLAIDYAVLYALVCREGGINAFVVSGYGLQQNVLIPAGTHEWVVVKQEHQWTVTDPAWGAGVVENGRFIRRINWSWFRMAPQIAVKTHMPYDPLWQLLAFPLRHDETGSQAFATAAKGAVFAYNDTLAVWTKQSRLERLQGALARIRLYGGAVNPFIMNEMEWMEQAIRVQEANREIAARNSVVDRFSALTTTYAETVKRYNNYVAFKNRQFTPEVSDAQLKKMMEEMTGSLTTLEQQLGGMQDADATMQQQLEEMKGTLAAIGKQWKQEQLFVPQYLRTAPAERKNLFRYN
ncbi:transglutaminase domain-containing protein [Chitinophaga nivalis]|uniref:Transglutaminase-like domain-containing protein n=1 Tax=Chitinophaga nivalis TaxID=2991709 RepID=A0ABT3IF99_9BACT|nr:transglutaminase domain-containing protein [Chitinophaga nivalis]MCW3467678.1 hypothetical protein [Chitinophaga nivalis]MCW3482630.1 hypothetical protein [Chitinophaga nivalis]